MSPALSNGGTLHPAVSVVIPCRNEVESIAGCLQSILAQRPPPGGFEVIVADGMSGDGTREVLRAMSASRAAGPPLRIIDNPGGIVSTGLNAAIREARGGLIVRMDCHSEYADDYLQQCVECIHSVGADNVGGPAHTRAHTYLQRAIAAAYHSPFSTGGARFHDVDHEGYVDTVTYGCWRREAFERFGDFDEELVRNQDDEHNLRITRAGGRIWQTPRIRSWYQPRGSLKALFRQYAQYGYWKVRVMRKHGRPASWRHLVPCAFVLFLFAFALLAGVAGVVRLAWGPPTGWPGWVENGTIGSSSVILACYAGVTAFASMKAARQYGWHLFPVLPVVFACYHLSYGLGFLVGIADLRGRGRTTRTMFTSLTRERVSRHAGAPDTAPTAKRLSEK